MAKIAVTSAEKNITTVKLVVFNSAYSSAETISAKTQIKTLLVTIIVGYDTMERVITELQNFLKAG